MSDQQDLNRAELARQVKENSVYQQAFTMLRADIFEKFSKSKTDDTEALQEMNRTLKNLDRLEKVLNHAMDTGKLIQEKRKRLKFLHK